MQLSQPSVVRFSTIWVVDIVRLNKIMARQHCLQHDCTCSLPRPDDRGPVVHLPLKDHPLFHLRKYTGIVAAIGLALSATSTGTYEPDSIPLFFNIFLLAASTLTCLADLISYARQNARGPETEPKWPKTKYIVIDCILAALLFVTFWYCFGYLSWAWSYYDSPIRVLQAYGALAGLICS